MQLTKLKISDLTPHPDNYNEHHESQIDELQSSLDMFGQFKNIVVSKGVIVCGHGLVEAAKQRGDTEIYALVRDDLSEDEIKAMLIADNETARLSIPNLKALKKIKLSIPDISIPGVIEIPKENPIFDFQNTDEYDKGLGVKSVETSNQIPLSVILNPEQNQKWEDYKANIKIKNDTKAFIALLGLKQ